jgi:hypothetical protein
METFLGIPLEEITTSGNNLFHWEGVVGDILITISGRMLPKDGFHYIVYVDLCGFPEKWWPIGRYKLAEASGENIKILELEIKRQLKRLRVNL